MERKKNIPLKILYCIVIISFHLENGVVRKYWNIINDQRFGLHLKHDHITYILYGDKDG